MSKDSEADKAVMWPGGKEADRQNAERRAKLPPVLYVLMADIDYAMRSSIDTPVGWTTDKATARKHMDEGEDGFHDRAVIICDQGKHGRFHWHTPNTSATRMACKEDLE